MALECVNDHRVFVYDRGGRQRLWELTNIASVKWGRIRDDISQAELFLSALSCDGQSSIISQIEPGRHEIVIHRNGVRVWEGPIVREKLTRQGAQFFARDVMHYAYRTVMHAAYSNAYPNVAFVTNRAEAILRGELARKEALSPPINVLPFLVNHHTPTDAETTRSTKQMSYTVFEHVDDLAAKSGMDYTVLGRAIHLWDTSKPLGTGPRLTEADFNGDLDITIYGMELATRAISTDGQGNYGSAGGVDPYYGEVERLYTAYDENEDSGPPPTQAELNSQAVRNLEGRLPTPVIMNVPAGSSLNPKGVVSIDHLVPGAYFPVSIDRFGRTFSQMQKLNRVQFVETPEGESITVDMGPATDADEEV